MFDNVRRIMVAAGGSPEDIIKMNVWIADRKLRDTMNRHWVEMFPDPHFAAGPSHDRPCRFPRTDADPMRLARGDRRVMLMGSC
jgi:enamine deaminase RidA (YjgF/YER057c/UK114 family)